uniref:MAT1-1-1 n=1 Tax=Juglanconis oblonga TaxID=1940568 RepID=A0A2P1NR22_9PEZI|nr:MAT1-1-1 [Juglanconis oblonga]AVP71785.1 MAT1-1-1 [Juglanconis oblonga]
MAPSKTLIPLPQLDSATDDIIHGPGNNQKAISKRSVGKHGKLMNKVEKKKVTVQAGTKGIAAKKAVNNYIIFRSMMSPLYPNFTQAQRSRFVKSMWEVELSKTSYGLMGRVWTFIRDNTDYRGLTEYLAGAGIICGVVSPDNFNKAYNLSFILQNDGSVDLVQTSPVLPGSIPPARNLSDFELLKELLLRGLPVERPMQLGKQMAEHYMHVMTVNKKVDFPVIEEVLAQSGRAVVGFTAQMDYNPIATCAELLKLQPTDAMFDFGVNVIDTEDITTFDPSMVLSIGPQTHRRYQWDTTTAHYAQPNCGAVNVTAVEDNVKIYNLANPHMWDNISGQVTQRDFVAAQHEEDQAKYDTFDMDDFFMPTAFDEEYPGFDLE